MGEGGFVTSKACLKKSSGCFWYTEAEGRGMSFIFNYVSIYVTVCACMRAYVCVCVHACT